jgi:hypothetical protein
MPFWVLWCVCQYLQGSYLLHFSLLAPELRPLGLFAIGLKKESDLEL